MNIVEVLKQIDFTQEEIELYLKYKSIIGNSLDGIVSDYLSRKIKVENLVPLAKEIFPDINEYTLQLMIALECTDAIYERCIKAQLGNEGFILTMRDIRCKVTECFARRKVFGISTLGWFDRFVFLYCYSFVRLQFDVTKHDYRTISYGNFTLNKGDFVLKCHIPSMGKLLHEDCIASYKQAYDYFKNELKDGILPIVCYSWLLYPPYLKPFGVNSNIGQFASDFFIYTSTTLPSLRSEVTTIVYSTIDQTTPIDKLPQDTSLQKRFIDHLKTYDYNYGIGRGLILFDGEKVITKNRHCTKI